MKNNYNLKKARELAGLTQADSAKLLGITPRRYQAIELGESDLNGKKIIILSKAFNVSADFLLGLKDTPN
ncbi:helix-turn-helix domain-containing protein [Enterococcus villorum]|uniref:helix-turn-helix domain-containing protein n=1 Tax=Enterococcus TaxID=1350 RepID=UPI0036408F43